jgi:hypothetical protein
LLYLKKKLLTDVKKSEEMNTNINELHNRVEDSSQIKDVFKDHSGGK